MRVANLETLADMTRNLKSVEHSTHTPPEDWQPPPSPKKRRAPHDLRARNEWKPGVKARTRWLWLPPLAGAAWVLGLTLVNLVGAAYEIVLFRPEIRELPPVLLIATLCGAAGGAIYSLATPVVWRFGWFDYARWFLAGGAYMVAVDIAIGSTAYSLESPKSFLEIMALGGCLGLAARIGFYKGQEELEEMGHVS